MNYNWLRARLGKLLYASNESGHGITINHRIATKFDDNRHGATPIAVSPAVSG
jgi:hypothetical protein